VWGGGGEFARTQQGNNNAWCQDNEISWLNWDLVEKNKGQIRFFSKLIRLRKEHAIFRRAEFFVDSNPDSPPVDQEIIWQGLHPGHLDWAVHSQTLSFTLRGCEIDDGDDANFFVMLNGQAEKSAIFTIPETGVLQRQCLWKKIIDTDQAAPKDFVKLEQAKEITVNSQIKVAPMGCIVLQTEEIK
ncbi:MAG: glycogen debranching enzyme, partial [Candidatus Electrothrix sp. AR3]|nr:glycogen debranching enzyme [Candidatus Electrothrix sp. AR3]